MRGTCSNAAPARMTFDGHIQTRMRTSLRRISMKISSVCKLWQLLISFLFIILIAGCSESAPPQVTTSTVEVASTVPQQSSSVPQQAADEAELVIQGGQMLDMVSNEPTLVPIKGMVIRDGKIDRIIAADSTDALPAAKRTVDASSLYILPGLIDPHIHFRPWTPSATHERRGYLHYGVTSLQDFSPCGAECKVADPNEWLAAYKELVNNTPDSAAPTLYIAGMKLEDAHVKPQAHSHPIQTIDEVDTYVDYLAGIGVDMIIVEEQLSIEFRQRAVEAARRHNLPFNGHAQDAREVIAIGQKLIEHMYPIAHSLADDPVPDETFVSPDYDHLMNMDKAPEFIKYMIDNQVYLNPTMTSRYGKLSSRAESYAKEDEALFEFGQLFSDAPTELRPRLLEAYRLPDIDAAKLQKQREGFEKSQAFLKQFTEAGGKVLAGTDNTDAKIPGVTMHRELQMLVDAGITPYRALLGATRWAADFIHRSDLVGTLEAGKVADVLLLGSNPADDITNSQDIRYVIRKGTVQRTPEDCSVIEPPISQTCQ